MRNMLYYFYTRGVVLMTKSQRDGPAAHERIFSAPGRVEIGGNHTDHQCGRVLTAAINLETTCEAVANGTDIVSIISDVFGKTEVDLTDLTPHDNEKGSTAALIRGVASWFRSNGHSIGGFDGNVSSGVAAGIGLSSSAAFEVLIGNVFGNLFNAPVSKLDIALAGQFAENVFFGKPCGLMDQAASSFGGLMMIDFNNPQKPVVTPICANMDGFAMCVVSTGCSHADLTDDYAAIPAEMRAIASRFGKKFLREVDSGEFYSSLADLRSAGDRALLRAMHFYEENERVAHQFEALKTDDFQCFLRLVTESGRSSLAYLQNAYSIAEPSKQGLTLALALCERILHSDGAYRVHGGGFAGTVLAFVPENLRECFSKQMSDVFGYGCCHFLKINAQGGREVFL